MSIPTPNYVLTEAVSIRGGPNGSYTLPARSFVRPIDPRWVPQHVIEKYPYFNKELECFVYCKYGIIVVRTNQLRGV